MPLVENDSHCTQEEYLLPGQPQVTDLLLQKLKSNLRIGCTLWSKSSAHAVKRSFKRHLIGLLIANSDVS